MITILIKVTIEGIGESWNHLEKEYNGGNNKIVPTLPRFFILIFLTLASHTKNNLHQMYYPKYSTSRVSPMIPKEKIVCFGPLCSFPFLVHSKCFLISPLGDFYRLSSRVSALFAASHNIFHMSLLSLELNYSLANLSPRRD